MFDEKINDILEENFGSTSVMDVEELRRLYYGRIDMFVTFSNSSDVEFIERPLKRVPAGLYGYSVFDVVGRKVKDPSFYAHVFREVTRKKFIQNIKTYSTSDLKRDLTRLSSYNGIEEEELFTIIEDNVMKSLLRTPFSKLWSITKEIAMKQDRSVSSMIWRDIFLFLGYNGIGDPNGSGILTGGKKHPVYLFFNPPSVIDIIPIQKHRKDKRNRVIDQVNRNVQKTETKRNRIAKRRFRDRKNMRRGMFLSKLIGALGAISL